MHVPCPITPNQTQSGIETGDPESAAVVNEERYVQHNPQTKEGGEGLAALFKRLSKTNPRVNIVRAFEDGDFVFGHTEYYFSSARVGFEVFRFEGRTVVEHWDNIQPRQGPNKSARSMVDGPTEATDLDKTEQNRAFVREFVETVLVGRQFDKIEGYLAPDFIEHSPMLADGVQPLLAALQETGPAVSSEDTDTDADADADTDTKSGDIVPAIEYQTVHRVLACGNFVLTVTEGARRGVHTSYYDLFRVAHGKVVEHWDTVEAVPPKSTWVNNNGKF